jgi:WW domain-containing oxidoreductase
MVLPDVGCCYKKGANGYGSRTTASGLAKDIGKRYDGKAVIVTGANAGIGLATAQALYESGATVIMACRSEARATAAMEKIKRQSGLQERSVGELKFLPLDLKSLKSTEAFVVAFVELKLPLVVLVNNAGVSVRPFALTEDGLHDVYQVNYLGHFYLTLQLLGALKESGTAEDPARIVHVSSSFHHLAPGMGVPW